MFSWSILGRRRKRAGWGEWGTSSPRPPHHVTRLGRVGMVGPLTTSTFAVDAGERPGDHQQKQTRRTDQGTDNLRHERTRRGRAERQWTDPTSLPKTSMRVDRADIAPCRTWSGHPTFTQRMYRSVPLFLSRRPRSCGRCRRCPPVSGLSGDAAHGLPCFGHELFQASSTLQMRYFWGDGWKGVGLT